MGNFEESFKLYQKVYNLRVKIFGEDHPDTIEALSNLSVGVI